MPKDGNFRLVLKCVFSSLKDEILNWNILRLYMKIDDNEEGLQYHVIFFECAKTPKKEFLSKISLFFF